MFYNLSTNQTVQAYMVKYKSIIMCNHYYEFENKMYPCMYVFKIQIIFYKIIVLFWTINKKFKIKKGKQVLVLCKLQEKIIVLQNLVKKETKKKTGFAFSRSHKLFVILSYL